MFLKPSVPYNESSSTISEGPNPFTGDLMHAGTNMRDSREWGSAEDAGKWGSDGYMAGDEDAASCGFDKGKIEVGTQSWVYTYIYRYIYVNACIEMMTKSSLLVHIWTIFHSLVFGRFSFINTFIIFDESCIDDMTWVCLLLLYFPPYSFHS